MQFCWRFQSVGDDEAIKEEESQGREREVDEEIERRISSAMCQPVPVGVFTRIQYLWTHVYPPRRHPEAISSYFSQTALPAPQASVTSEQAKTVTDYFILGRGVDTDDKNTRGLGLFSCRQGHNEGETLYKRTIFNALLVEWLLLV